MKVKAKDLGLPCLIEGKIYQVNYKYNDGHADKYIILDETGNENVYHHEHFTIADEPNIEVGSEWVSENGVVWIVKYVNKYVILNRDSILNKDSMEICVGVEKFFSKYKPKTKTVTMYFYKDCKGMVHAYSEPMPVFGDYLFTKEIEI